MQSTLVKSLNILNTLSDEYQGNLRLVFLRKNFVKALVPSGVGDLNYELAPLIGGKSYEYCYET